MTDFPISQSLTPDPADTLQSIYNRSVNNLNALWKEMYPAPRTLAQWGVPVILPSSGSMANNGAITLDTALPTTFANCWLFLPTSAIFAGSTAGVYFAQMSSTTAGTVYNNRLTSGAPSNMPSSPTPFVSTGPGSYAQNTSNNTIVTIPLLGGTLGPNGQLDIDATYVHNGAAHSNFVNVKLGGTQLAGATYSSNKWCPIKRTITNMGSESAQVMIVAATTANLASDLVVNSGTVSYLAIDTSIDQSLTFTASLVDVTDFLILQRVSLNLKPSV